MTRPNDESFPPTSRLLKSWQFREVLKKGRRIRTRNVIFYFLPRPEGASAIGITASKRVGNAVVRNRVKRLFREVFRRNRDKLPGAFSVVAIARPGGRFPNYDALRSEWLTVVSTLRRDRDASDTHHRRGH